MKLIQYDDKYIVFLNNLYLDKFNFDDSKAITERVKETIGKLNKYYSIVLKGFYKVLVYVNRCYGMIIEVLKLEEYDEYNSDSVDLKIIINNDTDIYLKTTNYDIVSEAKEFYYKNGYYYLNIKDISEGFDKYIEFFDIIYKDIDKILIDAKVIRRNLYE